jgi:hypothetical protein
VERPEPKPSFVEFLSHGHPWMAFSLAVGDRLVSVARIIAFAATPFIAKMAWAIFHG